MVIHLVGNDVPRFYTRTVFTGPAAVRNLQGSLIAGFRVQDRGICAVCGDLIDCVPIAIRNGYPRIRGIFCPYHNLIVHQFR